MSATNRWPSVGYKCAIQKMIRFFLFLRADEDAQKREAFKRAGGRVICDECGFEFNDHVQDPIEPWLNVLCNGERVKL